MPTNSDPVKCAVKRDIGRWGRSVAGRIPESELWEEMPASEAGVTTQAPDVEICLQQIFRELEVALSLLRTARNFETGAQTRFTETCQKQFEALETLLDENPILSQNMAVNSDSFEAKADLICLGLDISRISEKLYEAGKRATQKREKGLKYIEYAQSRWEEEELCDPTMKLLYARNSAEPEMREPLLEKIGS
jgi:hypothetical protein